MAKPHIKQSSYERIDVHDDMVAELIETENGECFDLCIIHLDGEHGPVHNKTITETFHILEGEITYTIADKTFTAKAGDTVVSKPKIWRHLKGKGKFLAICNPPYQEDDQEFKDTL